MARCNSRRGNQERGFALLLIFLMASVLAIMLYMELPRTAMQAQRDKEETLIDRGEQYKRAIQLFVNKAKRYPADIKDLENFQNQRFLRQRYADPMTGKDEWRLIHVQNGMLTDSKVTKPNGATGGPDQAKTPNGFVGEQIGLGGAPNQGQAGGAANVRDRRRPSEGANSTMPGNTPGQGPAGGDPSGQNQNTLPGQVPDGSGTSPTGQPGQPPYPGMPGVPSNPSTANPPGTSTGGSNTPVGGGGGFVGGGGPFVGGGSTSTNTGQTMPGGGSGQTYPPQPGQNGMPPGMPGTTTGQSNAAADMIRNILTTPRPGGMPTGNTGGQTFGGGIAGVASTAEGEGVKVYNDRTLYQEWEFIFDPAKQKQIPNPNSLGAIGTPAGNMNSPQPSQQQGAPGMSPGAGGPASRPFGQ